MQKVPTSNVAVHAFLSIAPHVLQRTFDHRDPPTSQQSPARHQCGARAPDRQRNLITLGPLPRVRPDLQRPRTLTHSVQTVPRPCIFEARLQSGSRRDTSSSRWRFCLAGKVSSPFLGLSMRSARCLQPGCRLKPQSLSFGSSLRGDIGKAARGFLAAPSRLLSAFYVAIRSAATYAVARLQQHCWSSRSDKWHCIAVTRLVARSFTPTPHVSRRPDQQACCGCSAPQYGHPRDPHQAVVGSCTLIAPPPPTVQTSRDFSESAARQPVYQQQWLCGGSLLIGSLQSRAPCALARHIAARYSHTLSYIVGYVVLAAGQKAGDVDCRTQPKLTGCMQAPTRRSCA
jgi:hypothetical protein